MTKTHGERLLQPFIESAKIDGDPYLLCHFSRQEDSYTGYHDGLDGLDAMIIIKHLVKEFNIDGALLITALPSDEQIKLLNH